MDIGFLIELPSHKVKELTGNKMVAVTDREMCVYNVDEINEALEMIESMTDTLIEKYAIDGVSSDLLATLVYLKWGVRSLILVSKCDMREVKNKNQELFYALVGVIEDLNNELHKLTD